MSDEERAINTEEIEHLRKIFDAPIENADDAIALSKLCNDETKED